MGRFAEINRTYDIKLEDLKKIMIDTFVREEGIDSRVFKVDLSFNLGNVGGCGMRDEGYTAVTGATFIVTKMTTTHPSPQWEDR